MAGNFFITGLPRSRTAWLATYFSMLDGVHCYHEGLKGCRSEEHFRRRMTCIPNAIVGNSDSVLPLTSFRQMFPDAPLVVIERPIEQVLWSMKQLKLDGPGAVEVAALTYAKLEGLGGFRVQFDAIDDDLPDICFHIGVEYDQRKHQLLRKMNIQTMDFRPDPESLAVWI